ncbi:MAG: glycoside hydrolase family 5 protein [Huintestinicola sp.]|uniref:glycoside hydrolase family 5 protein n=1 Tax=Huintestinicola sp. TaxID=2981661 RepID=UPI003F0575C3
MQIIKAISKFTALVLSLSMLTALLSGCGEPKGEMRNMSTMEIVKDMGLGINLGNTFESCGGWINSSSVTNYETGWGSPVITEDIIKGYAESGFGVLRIPVAWSNMMSGDYDINPEYLARVKQVVDWALATDMYVILNIHWDGGWFEKFSGKDKDECMHKYERIWTQLTAEFKNYSDKLMFESLNEEGCWDDIWNRYSGKEDGKAEAFGLLNEINQKFVDLVRASGGNNKKRHLLIAGYATDISLTCDELYKMPVDPENRCAVSVHYYTPSTFAILEKDASWGKCRKDWGTDADMAELEKNMDMMKEHFVDKGIPVIIGEYGCPVKNKDKDSIKKYLTSVCEVAYDRDMCPVLWDVTDAFYSRTECSFKDKDILKGLMDVKN